MDALYSVHMQLRLLSLTLSILTFSETKHIEFVMSSVSNSKQEVNNFFLHTIFQHQQMSWKMVDTHAIIKYLSPKISIEKNIANARQAFFGFWAFGLVYFG